MSKKIYIPLILAAFGASIIGCNKSEDYSYEASQSSSVLVNSFRLLNNDKVLDSLGNVYFSIDLVGGRIFNADSLPYGTNVSRLVTSIVTVSTASSVTMKYYDTHAQTDTVIDYLKHSTDSIDFTHPATMTVVSENGLVTRDYIINVNVHRVKADTLAWYSIESAPLPSDFGTIEQQCTAVLDGNYVCLTSSRGKYCMATTRTPDMPAWTSREVTFGFTPYVESLRATDSAYYILDEDGHLYTSTDFETWTDTGCSWHYLYGAYGDEILGSAQDSEGRWLIASYPSGKTWVMPSDFPIAYTSLPAVYDTPMAYAPQLVICGGANENGATTDKCWGFDGTDWACISMRPMPVGLMGPTVVPYTMVDVPSTTWTPTDFPALVMMGGINSKGELNDTVYYSRDWGMTWAKAPQTMQLPDEIPPFYNASAYVYNTVMHASRSQYWQEIPVIKIPASCSYMLPARSRAVAPITEWECPAIYVFGGRDDSWQTRNTLWRGVIRQFTFKPVQ